MLEIHERFQCGIPVVIEGETGVGKTALLEMLSVLWNQSLLSEQRLLVDRVLTLLQRVCSRKLFNMYIRIFRSKQNTYCV